MNIIPHQRSSRALGEINSGQKRAYVLLIGGHPADDRQLASDLAKSAGADLLVAGSHAAAMDFMQRYRPGCVVLSRDTVMLGGCYFPELLSWLYPEARVIVAGEASTGRPGVPGAPPDQASL